MGFRKQGNREIKSSGDNGIDSVISTLAPWYDFRERGGYLENIGQIRHLQDIDQPGSNGMSLSGKCRLLCSMGSQTIDVCLACPEGVRRVRIARSGPHDGRRG